MMERTEFVRRLLKKHRKELDESAFNNQVFQSVESELEIV